MITDSDNKIILCYPDNILYSYTILTVWNYDIGKNKNILYRLYWRENLLKLHTRQKNTTDAYIVIGTIWPIIIKRNFFDFSK